MKYTLEIDIDRPRAQVAALYDDPANWPLWQASFISAQSQSGGSREPGARTRLVHRVGGRNTEMTETIESKQLPEQMSCIYEAKGAWNRVLSRFEELEADRTRWVFESEFRCTGVLRVMSVLMPGMFCKASWKEMISFKRFAETAGR